MLTNTIIILNGHFHDVLGHPVPPWNLLEIAVVVFFLGWMPILFTSRQSQNNENKKLSYHRDSAGRRSLYAVQGRSRSLIFVPINFVVNKADDRAGSKTLFLLHSQTYETYNLKFHVFLITIFANLRPPSKCRLVRPAPAHSPRYASDYYFHHRQQHHCSEQTANRQSWHIVFLCFKKTGEADRVFSSSHTGKVAANNVRSCTTTNQWHIVTFWP